MKKNDGRNSAEVTHLLKSTKHPLTTEINFLRRVILDSSPELVEGVKWNAPNYSCEGNDIITMRIQPLGLLQLVFHRGARTKASIPERLIKDESGLLQWRANDRAIISFPSMESIQQGRPAIESIVRSWVTAVSGER